MDRRFRRRPLARALTGATQVEAVAYGMPKRGMFQNYGFLR